MSVTLKLTCITLNYIELKEGVLHNMVGFSMFLRCVMDGWASNFAPAVNRGAGTSEELLLPGLERQVNKARLLWVDWK